MTDEWEILPIILIFFNNHQLKVQVSQKQPFLHVAIFFFKETCSKLGLRMSLSERSSPHSCVQSHWAPCWPLTRSLKHLLVSLTGWWGTSEASPQYEASPLWQTTGEDKNCLLIASLNKPQTKAYKIWNLLVQIVHADWCDFSHEGSWSRTICRSVVARAAGCCTEATLIYVSVFNILSERRHEAAKTLAFILYLVYHIRILFFLSLDRNS